MAKRIVAPKVGDVFGRLTVIAPAPRTSHHYRWLCRCECGTEKTVAQDGLLRGGSTSCGCRRIELATKHGMARTREGRAWRAMIDRCYNPAHPSYPRYGGRGIAVCDEWRNDPTAFVTYLGLRPTPQHSLDRPNNDGPYAPGNVRWSTKREQAQNRSNNRLLTLHGVTKPMIEWARDLGGERTLIVNRLRLGWPLEKALTEPLDLRKGPRKARRLRAHSKALAT
jgi:hypothetical protein